jgi:hypothetical protein
MSDGPLLRPDADGVSGWRGDARSPDGRGTPGGLAPPHRRCPRRLAQAHVDHGGTPVPNDRGCGSGRGGVDSPVFAYRERRPRRAATVAPAEGHGGSGVVSWPGVWGKTLRSGAQQCRPGGPIPSTGDGSEVAERPRQVRQQRPCVGGGCRPGAEAGNGPRMTARRQGGRPPSWLGRHPEPTEQPPEGAGQGREIEGSSRL